MKKTSLVYISKNYNYYELVSQLIQAQRPITDIILCKYRPLDVELFRRDSIPFQVVQKDILFNFIRDTAFLTMIFYDGEDTHAEVLVKYCEAHRVPLLINSLGEVNQENIGVYKSARINK